MRRVYCSMASNTWGNPFVIGGAGIVDRWQSQRLACPPVYGTMRTCFKT